MLHLRERAKGRVLRKRRDKKRANKRKSYDYGSELGEEDQNIQNRGLDGLKSELQITEPKAKTFEPKSKS